MARITYVNDVDFDAIKAKMDAKGFDQNYMAEKMGIDHSTFSKKLIDKRPISKMELSFIAMILECSEDELIIKPVVVPPATEVQNALNSNEIIEKLDKVIKDQETMASDLLHIARMLAEVQKVTNESKAHCELLQDEVNNISSKCFSISNTVNKISGWINAKYRANNK